MSADNCGYCGASLIYMDGTYVCPDCTLTLGEQREIRRYIRDNNTPHNELPVWLVSLIARAEAAEARAEKLQAALHDIFEACYAADCDGELDSRIDGDILDAARLALKGGEE